jgi:hypothetical protein
MELSALRRNHAACRASLRRATPPPISASWFASLPLRSGRSGFTSGSQREGSWGGEWESLNRTTILRSDKLLCDHHAQLLAGRGRLRQVFRQVARQARPQRTSNLLLGDENRHAFLWRNGVMTDLGTLGYPESESASINSQGQIVGSSFVFEGPSRGLIWENGAPPADLNTLVSPGAST